MKIGILTLKLHTNYGGILQAYALQTILERMGHEVLLFNKPQSVPKFSIIVLLKRLILKLMGRNVIIFYEIKSRREAPVINKCVWDFRKKYIHEVIINQLSEINNYNLDCIIVGSDQIWRAKYFKALWTEPMENAFLAFTKGRQLKRIAYAASFGVDEWEYSETETSQIKEAITLFDAISVREDSGIQLLKDNVNVDSLSVLDPTLLLQKEDYIKIFEIAKVPKSKGNLLVYLLDPNKKQKQLIQCIETDTQLIPFYVNKRSVSPSTPIKERILPSVESWLRGFYDAEFVITDSFHACVFSIIFEKPFVVFGNKSRGMSRFDSLLNKFGLSSCLIGDDISVESIIEVISKRGKALVSSNTIREKLKTQKEYSINYLSNSLYR